MINDRDRMTAVFFTTLPSFPDAACASETDPDLFFPDPKDVDTQTIAKRICGGCPHRAPCLEYALAHELDHGIFGGTTPDERWKLRPRRDRRHNQYTLRNNGGAA